MAHIQDCGDMHNNTVPNTHTQLFIPDWDLILRACVHAICEPAELKVNILSDQMAALCNSIKNINAYMLKKAV